MSKCAKVEPVVKKVLTEKPYTREDDFMLVYEVYNEFLPNLSSMSFEDVMKNHKGYGLPYFESIRRTRPKLQNKFPELLPSEETQIGRKLEEADYKSYALS
jgi:hypothetical protein